MGILNFLDNKFSNHCYIELDFGHVYFRSYKTGYIYDGPLYLWTKGEGKLYKNRRSGDPNDINKKVIEYVGINKRDHDCIQVISATPPIIPIFEPAVAAFRFLIQESIKDKGILFLVKPIFVVKMNCTVTPVEQRIIKEVLEQTGCRKIIYTQFSRPFTGNEFLKLIN